MAPRELQEASRCPQDHSKRPQDGSRSAPRGLETLEEAPRAPQKVSRRLRRLQDGSNSLQIASKTPEGRHTFCTTVDLEKFSLADFSLHAGSTPWHLSGSRPSDLFSHHFSGPLFITILTSLKSKKLDWRLGGSIDFTKSPVSIFSRFLVPFWGPK